MQSAVPEGTAGMLVFLNMPIDDVYLIIEKINDTTFVDSSVDVIYDTGLYEFYYCLYKISILNKNIAL